MTLKEKYDRLMNIMAKHSDLGAMDSEPVFQLENALFRLVHKDIKRAPQNASEWELYPNEGCETAARELTRELEKLLDEVEKAPFKEVKELIRWAGIQK